MGAVIASFFFILPGAGGGVVNLKGKGGEWVFPIDATATVAVSGPLGDTIVEIGGDSARVVSSPCLNQTCVAAGSIHSAGQWSACLPNQVMVYISRDDAGAGGGSRATSDGGKNVDASAW